MGRPEVAEKTCAACGRRFAWQKRWARNWDSVRYCSAACRRQKPNATDAALEQAILSLLDPRDGQKTICPSEAARQVAGDEENGWRDLLERTRRAARRLVAAGRVDILQGGRVVDPSTARGPIRVRRRKAAS